MKKALNFVENHASACKIIAKTQDELAQVVSVRTLVAFLKDMMADMRVTLRSTSPITMTINSASGLQRKQDGRESTINKMSSIEIRRN